MSQEIKISRLSKMASPTDHTNSRYVDTVEVQDLEHFSQAICSYNVSNFLPLVPPNFLNTVPLDFHDRVPPNFLHVVPRYG